MSPRFVSSVAAGGAAGSLVRWAVTDWLDGDGGTLAVNLIGSFLIGVLSARRRGDADRSWWFGGVGFCGGLTTFAGHAVDVASHLRAGDVPIAIGLAFVTAAGAVALAVAGHRVARAIGGQPETTR